MGQNYFAAILQGESTDADVMEYGSALASSFEAHLDAVSVTPSADDIIAATAAAGGMPAATGATLEAEQKRTAQRTKSIQAAFREHSGSLPKIEDPASTMSASIRLVELEGLFDRVGISHARLADLCIAALPGSSDNPSQWHIAESLLFDSGRPVLFVPPGATLPSRQENVVVAWNGSAQAARAMHDSILFLPRDAKVTLVSAGKAPHPGPAMDVLKRHGIAVATAQNEEMDDQNAGEAILTAASDLAASLIVMGGYGRGRLQEFIFGGATRTLLRDSPVPVLMAH